MPFELPPMPSRAEIGYLPAEIAGEGLLVGLVEDVGYTPPPVSPVMPDQSQIKSIRHYFGRRGAAPVYPAWLYHPTLPPMMVSDALGAKSLGVTYREATNEERSRYGVKAVWDYEEGSQWRPAPWAPAKLDPSSPGTGKTFIAGTPTPATTNMALAEALVPQVAAAVAKALSANGPAAPASIDPEQWKQFLEFQAFRESQKTVDAVVGEAEQDSAKGRSEISDMASALADTSERGDLMNEARLRGIAVDGRWSTETLKQKLKEAA